PSQCTQPEDDLKLLLHHFRYSTSREITLNCESQGRRQNIVRRNMFHNQTWFPKSMIRIRNHKLSSFGPLWFLVLLLTPTLASVPAAAQYNAYVAQNASNSVWVINTMTDRVVAVIPVQFSPFGIAITPNAAFAYVSNTGVICDLCPIAQSGSVSVIDTAAYKVVATISVGQYPAGVAVTPDGAFSYVTNFNSNTVSVINTVTNTVTATVGVGTEPLFVAITPNGAFTYVTNACDSTVSVINTATNAVVATVAVGPDPENIAITPDGFFAYTSNFLTGSLSVIDTATNRVVDTIQAAGTAPLGIAIR